MTDRLTEILSDLAEEMWREQARQREANEQRQAATDAIKASMAARSKIESPPDVELGTAAQANRNFRRAKSVKQMKAMMRNQGKVE